MNSVVTLYNGLLTSINVFYIVYRLNEDDNFNKFSSYIIPILVYGLFSSQLIIIFPDLNAGFRIVLNLVAIVLIVWILLKHNAFKALVSVIISILITGFGDAAIALLYVFPFKIVVDDYLNSPFHITVGQLIVFIVSFCLIKLFREKIKSIINQALTKHYELMIVLSIDLLAVCFLLGLSTGVFYNYLIKDGTAFGKEYILPTMILIIIALLIISGVTLYSMNSSILNKLKLKQNMNIYNIDDLTGAMNRGAGITFLKDQLRICKQENLHITICYMDIDNLKIVNDRYGHNIYFTCSK